MAPSLWTVIRISLPPPPPPSWRGVYPSLDLSSGSSTRAPDYFEAFISIPGRFQESQRADMTASTTVFSVFSGIGLILSVVPLYWHLKARSVGTCVYMIWTALGCLVYFVNSIVWNGNAINWAPAWCDFCTYTCAFAQFLSLTDSRSYSHSNRRCCRIARLHSLHRSSPPLYRHLYRCDNH
jgi:multidrug transporter EmrE-like cation transporter